MHQGSQARPDETPPLSQLRCRYGEMVVPLADTYIGRSLRLYGEYTELEGALLRGYLAADATVIDVGANIGAHSLLFATAAPRGRVLAIEPQPTMSRLLRGNLALNGMAHVEVLEAAAGAAAGTLHIADQDLTWPGNFGLYSPANFPGETELPLLPLDSLALERCDLIKCDVEGMEIGVLEGARETIARHRPVLYIENDRPAHACALVGLILSLGYRVWWHTPPYFNPANFNNHPVNVFGDLRSLNVLCLHGTRRDVPRGLVELKRAESGWPPIILLP